MKKYFLALIFTSSILVMSGCSMLNYPEKTLANSTDVQICDRTGGDMTETIRVLKPETFTKEKALASLTVTKHSYIAELHKSDNKDIEAMLNLMISSNEKITHQVQHNGSMDEARSTWKHASQTWVYICTSLAEEM